MPGIWAEFCEDSEIRGALPDLAARGFHLALALPSERIGDAAYAALTRQARDAGVSVRAWPLLPRAAGYWIGETNAAEAALAIDEIVRWRERSGGPALDAISIDLEPDFAYAERLREIGRDRPLQLLPLLLEHVDRGRFDLARDTLARSVDGVKKRALLAHAVAPPLLLDQGEADTLEDALDTPLSGIAWDEVSFMSYQTPFAQLTGHWLGPALVHSYAKSAVERFGDRAGIDVGIVGDAGVGVDPGDRYPTPGALWLDVEAALAAGISLDKIRIYGLAGVLASGGIERWLDFSRLEPRAPKSNRLVDGMRNGIKGLSTALASVGKR